MVDVTIMITELNKLATSYRARLDAHRLLGDVDQYRAGYLAGKADAFGLVATWLEEELSKVQL